MNLGEQIKTLRKSRNWTQAELAEKCGLTTRTIQRIESNEVQPSLYSKKRLQEILETDWEESTAKNPKVPKKSIFQKPQKSMKTILILSIPLLLSLLGGIWYGNSLPLVNMDGIPPEITTVNCGSATECDIQVTRKDPLGEILWQKTYGGTSYDKASGITPTSDGGFLILGSTSSFGKGNYDILLIKIDATGEEIWKKTYGEFFNEYGLNITSKARDEYEIEGSKQTCTTPNVSEYCQNRIWTFRITSNGDLVS